MAVVKWEKKQKQNKKTRYPDKEPVGSKQPSLIFLTCKIQQ